jgi:preprotein translocase SecE subunit
MARNRQRTRPGRPPGGARPDAPTPSGDGLTPPPPPIGENPGTVFADADDDGRGESAFGVEAGGDVAADAAFGRAETEQQRESGNIVGRTFGFLRNCWAELQRVQWPDRQQVAQATGVVLGFVVLTGIFLGICDFVAGKLVNWIV